MISCFSELEAVYSDYRSRRFTSEASWLTGNCFQYACIMREWLSLHCVVSKIVYDVIDGHFLVASELPMKADDTVTYSFLLDFSGIIVLHPGFVRVLGDIFYNCSKHSLVDWVTYGNVDPLHWKRIRNDCCL